MSRTRCRPDVHFLAPAVVQTISGDGRSSDDHDSKRRDRPGAASERRNLYVLSEPDLINNHGMGNETQARSALALLDYLNSTDAEWSAVRRDCERARALAKPAEAGVRRSIPRRHPDDLHRDAARRLAGAQTASVRSGGASARSRSARRRWSTTARRSSARPGARRISAAATSRSSANERSPCSGCRRRSAPKRSIERLERSIQIEACRSGGSPASSARTPRRTARRGAITESVDRGGPAVKVDEVQTARPGDQGGDRKGGRRPGHERRADAGGAVRRRAHPARRSAGHGQDAAGAQLRPGGRARFRAHPVHAGPDARRHHRRQPVQFPDVELHADPRADLHRTAACRRDQPHAAQDPGCAARSDAGAAGDDRRRKPRAQRPVHGRRDSKPDRAAGRLSAARGAARPLPVQADGRLSLARGGAEDHRHPRRREDGDGSVGLGRRAQGRSGD